VVCPALQASRGFRGFRDRIRSCFQVVLDIRIGLRLPDQISHCPFLSIGLPVSLDQTVTLEMTG
jgi:hypothetical protein